MSTEVASDKIEFSEDSKNKLAEILQNYPNKEAAMLPVLHLAKQEFRIITPDVMEYVAELLDVSPINVINVVSFFSVAIRESIETKYVFSLPLTFKVTVLLSGITSGRAFRL